MAIYRYQPGSLLDEVTILSNEGGGMRAYLHAAPQAQSEFLRRNKMLLRKDDYVCIPSIHEGRPVLEVRGFKNHEELLGALEKQNLINGAPSVISDANDELTRKQKGRAHTLQLAGFSYNIGDSAYMFYTIAPLAKKWTHLPKEKFGERFFGVLDVLAGIGYGVGSLCLTVFGSRDQSINTITSSTSKIERYARKEGYEISPESSISYVNQKPDRTIREKISDVISRYPSEAMNSIYVAVGLCLSAASVHRATRQISKALPELEYKAAIKAQRWDKIDVGLGAVTATSGIIGLTVKERKKLEGDPDRTGVKGFIDWIREKPLRATGYGLMIATGFHAVATAGKWKEGKKEDRVFLIGRVIFICTNIISEVLIALSSKGHGIGVKPDDSVDKSISATVAELVARQPVEKRESMIQQFSGYIASPEVSAVRADDTSKNLRAQVAALDSNPWTAHYKGKQPTPQVTASTSEGKLQHANAQLALQQ